MRSTVLRLMTMQGIIQPSHLLWEYSRNSGKNYSLMSEKSDHEVRQIMIGKHNYIYERT